MSVGDWEGRLDASFRPWMSRYQHVCRRHALMWCEFEIQTFRNSSSRWHVIAERLQSRYYFFNTPSTTFMISTNSSSIILFPITCTCVGKPSHSSASSATHVSHHPPSFRKDTYKAVRTPPPPSKTPYHPPSPPSQPPAPHSANSAN